MKEILAKWILKYRQRHNEIARLYLSQNARIKEGQMSCDLKCLVMIIKRHFSREKAFMIYKIASFLFCCVITDKIVSPFIEAINSISIAAQWAAAVLKLTSHS